LLTSLVTVSFSRRTLLHGLSFRETGCEVEWMGPGWV